MHMLIGKPVLAASLRRKFKLAVPECRDHVTTHEAFEDVLLPRDVEEWRTAVEAWEGDNTNPNPFEVKFDGESSCRFRDV